MSWMFEGSTGCLRKTKAVSSAPAAWNIGKISPRKINRRDLRRLYGLDPVPDYIYESIMRADMDKATELELIILEEYVEEKKMEIRARKEELGLEGGGTRYGVGRAAENIFNINNTLERNVVDDDNE